MGRGMEVIRCGGDKELSKGEVKVKKRGSMGITEVGCMLLPMVLSFWGRILMKMCSICQSVCTCT